MLLIAEINKSTNNIRLYILRHIADRKWLQMPRLILLLVASILWLSADHVSLLLSWVFGDDACVSEWA